MSKRKYVVIAVATFVLVVSVGVSIWHARGHRSNRTSQKTSDSQGGSSDSILLTQSNINGIPLNGSQSETDTGGLKVATGSPATNLGQLVPTADSSGNSSSANSSSKPKPFDPATFSQYDKYKDSQSALFGDAQAGNGAEVAANKKVAIYYKGWLTDGRLFDMSRTDDKGKLQPLVFTEGAHAVIPGLEEGLLGMKVGGMRLVIVPPAVGYGASGKDPIPGNAVLIFQVQLLAVE